MTEKLEAICSVSKSFGAEDIVKSSSMDIDTTKIIFPCNEITVEVRQNGLRDISVRSRVNKMAKSIGVGNLDGIMRLISMNSFTGTISDYNDEMTKLTKSGVVTKSGDGWVLKHFGHNDAWIRSFAGGAVFIGDTTHPVYGDAETMVWAADTLNRVYVLAEATMLEYVKDGWVMTRDRRKSREHLVMYKPGRDSFVYVSAFLLRFPMSKKNLDGNGSFLSELVPVVRAIHTSEDERKRFSTDNVAIMTQSADNSSIAEMIRFCASQTTNAESLEELGLYVNSWKQHKDPFAGKLIYPNIAAFRDLIDLGAHNLRSLENSSDVSVTL